MNGITGSRQALGAALEAAGIRVAYDPGLVVAPGVLVVPESPWISPTALASRPRALRWRVVAIAGLADSTATLDNLEDLVGLVALADLPPGFGMTTWDAPGTVDVAGAQYLAAIGRLDHITEV